MPTDATVYWSPGMSLEVLEQMVIQKAFKHYQGNKTATANSLGIAIRTLDAKIEKYEMDEIEREEQNADRRRDRELQLARSRGITSKDAAIAAASLQSNHQAGEGFRAQPIANAPAQQPMSVSVGQEVQKVLPKNVASGHSRKSR